MGTEKKEEEKPSFEQAFKDLADTVNRLESGELNLEETMQAFERGMVLARYCNTMLDQAELKVQELSENTEGYVLKDITLSGR